jgi:ribosomal 30S subunit maturation factor RimM
MVTINENGFTLTYKSDTPIEDYLELKENIIKLLSSQNPEIREDDYYVLQLLRNMEFDKNMYKKIESLV